jgi:hypothetical protein
MPYFLQLGPPIPVSTASQNRTTVWQPDLPGLSLWEAFHTQTITERLGTLKFELWVESVFMAGTEIQNSRSVGQPYLTCYVSQKQKRFVHAHGRVLALKAQSPEFKPQSHQKKKGFVHQGGNEEPKQQS